MDHSAPIHASAPIESYLQPELFTLVTPTSTWVDFECETGMPSPTGNVPPSPANDKSVAPSSEDNEDEEASSLEADEALAKELMRVDQIIKAVMNEGQPNGQQNALGNDGDMFSFFNASSLDPFMLRAALQHRMDQGLADKRSKKKRRKSDTKEEDPEIERELAKFPEGEREKQRKVLKNRLAARSFRRRQREHINEMSKHIDELQDENASLKSALKLVVMENSMMKEQLFYMKTFFVQRQQQQKPAQQQQQYPFQPAQQSQQPQPQQPQQQQAATPASTFNCIARTTRKRTQAPRHSVKQEPVATSVRPDQIAPPQQQQQQLNFFTPTNDYSFLQKPPLQKTGQPPQQQQQQAASNQQMLLFQEFLRYQEQQQTGHQKIQQRQHAYHLQQQHHPHHHQQQQQQQRSPPQNGPSLFAIHLQDMEEQEPDLLHLMQPIPSSSSIHLHNSSPMQGEGIDTMTDTDMMMNSFMMDDTAAQLHHVDGFFNQAVL